MEFAFITAPEVGNHNARYNARPKERKLYDPKEGPSEEVIRAAELARKAFREEKEKES